LAGKAVALIEGEGRKARLVEISPEARGIEPGCAVALAMARCPGIVLRTRDVGAEVEAQRMLLASGFALSPRVEATGPGWCTIDLQGADAERAETELRRQVADLTRLGLPARGGMAPTPLLASYAAQGDEPVLVVDDPHKFLQNLPLATAGPSVQQAEVLRGWGLKTLADLTALPKADIGQRLGPEGVALWERAAGETTRPLRLVELPRSFTAEWIYEPPVDTLEPLAFKLQRFSERVACELRAAGFVAEKLALTLFLEDGKDYRREFRLPEPVADAASWMRVLLAHLESVKLDSLLARVRLVAEPARPQQKQDGLFDTGLRDPAAFWENLARLGALVGDDRVGTPEMSNTHRPEAFVLVKPVATVPAPEEPPCHPARGLILRRFRPGWPVHVDCLGGNPIAISGTVSGTITTTQGPWRADGEWWKPTAWAVESWRVELADGSVYQLARDNGAWRVEGVLD
jgi:protein ImuB